MSVEIVRVFSGAWERVRSLRLRSLSDAPDAFGATLASEQGRPGSWWRARIDDRAVHHLIATLDGQDAGVTVVAPRREDPQTAGMFAVFVVPGARGRGVGDALVRAAIAAARADGFPRLLLDVGDHNAPAIALYARHGFVPTGRTSTLGPRREHITEHERVLEL